MNNLSFDDGPFYVIDYDANPIGNAGKIEGVGRFVLQKQKIEPREKDEIRDLFHSMRDISRENRSVYFRSNRFFDKRAQREKALVFRKQALFMKDFNDDYANSAPLASYFPDYQMLDYEQLRAYFTWRTKVRQGNVTETSLSYGFLYIYELLNNIGVDNPKEGLVQLMSFWKAFCVYNDAIDKYIIRWLKDYHIYYELPQPFSDFAKENGLTRHYPKMTNPDDTFEFFRAISKYDIRQSAFYLAGNQKLVQDCFCFVINQLRQTLQTIDAHFDDSLFGASKKTAPWQPFKDAVFHPWLRQPNRKVVLSENEIYICEDNNWTTSAVITTESGRRLIGYIMKQTESVLREAANYKHKLSANISTVEHVIINTLKTAGVSLEKLIGDSVTKFYKEATRTVVTVDRSALSRIRQEALITQERLVVPEQERAFVLPQIAPNPVTEAVHEVTVNKSNPLNDGWASFKASLSELELQALTLVSHDGAALKQFADDNGIMLEVLMDCINGKAMDFIGDNLLDNEFQLYDDYSKQAKEMVR